jgi:hypothetical protein
VSWQMPCLVPALVTTVEGGSNDRGQRLRGSGKVLNSRRTRSAVGQSRNRKSRLLWQWFADRVSKIPRPSGIISQRRRNVAGVNV